jgi:hypothetical protein
MILLSIGLTFFYLSWLLLQYPLQKEEILSDVWLSLGNNAMDPSFPYMIKFQIYILT